MHFGLKHCMSWFDRSSRISFHNLSLCLQTLFPCIPFPSLNVSSDRFRLFFFLPTHVRKCRVMVGSPRVQCVTGPIRNVSRSRKTNVDGVSLAFAVRFSLFSLNGHGPRWTPFRTARLLPGPHLGRVGLDHCKNK